MCISLSISHREELDENKIKPLNLGPKFVPTENRKRPYIDIIQTTEICALDLEREGKFSIAESLRQNISRIITKDLKKKHKNNLNFAERKVLTEIQHDKNISIYPFDKGTGFVVINEKDAIQKIEEKIRKSKIIDYDSKLTLLNKFQKELAKLRKESKFDNNTYFKLYPSDAIRPPLYGVIKAQKPEKLSYDDNTVNQTNRLAGPTFGGSV